MFVCYYAVLGRCPWMAQCGGDDVTRTLVE